MQFELADLRHRPPRLLRDPPSTRHTTERRPTIAQSEQGTAVPTNQRVEDVAILVLEAGASEQADLPDAGGARGHRLVLRGIAERGHSLHRQEVPLPRLDRAVPLLEGIA